MQIAFGSGSLFATQLTDASGNAISNPTPYQLAVLQEASLDISGDLKQLYGQSQFPVAVGRGKGKVQVKAKPARIMAGLWNSIFFGQTLTAGILSCYTDTTGTAIPTTPYQITPTPPSSGTWIADMGVVSGVTGLPLTRVASAPATGQYSVAAGVYTFAAADTGLLMYINYQYTTSTIATGQREQVNNLPMGYAPAFKADLTVSYQGKNTTFSFYKCIANKMGMAFKNEDFAVPEFDFEAFDDGTGKVMTWSVAE